MGVTYEIHKDSHSTAASRKIDDSGCEVFLLLAEELPHARLPAAALVQGDASVLGAAPRESRALPSQDVHELLLGQALHLVHQRGQDRPCHVMSAYSAADTPLNVARSWVACSSPASCRLRSH